jgi:hypothetical protein
MRSAAGRRADVAVVKDPARPWRGIVAAVALALSAAACTTNSQPTVATSTPKGPTVAFESIDGPPESIFQKLVQNLSEEADARQMAVVSREGPAQYRVRGYVSAQSKGKRSTVAWVWDIYDADQRRALRITGEELATAGGHGTWAIADDQLLRRIARTGMDRLVAFLASPNAQPDAAPPPDRAPSMTVASAGDDLAPELSIPLPRRRPAGTGFTTAGSLAYLPPSR